MADQQVKVSPLDWIILLITTKNIPFDQAFSMTDDMMQKQCGQKLDRKRMATMVLKQLEKIRVEK